MIATLLKNLKKYQDLLRNPAMAAPNHSGSIEKLPSLVHDQPMPGMVLDPVQGQAAAEEQFFAEQLASGHEVISSGLIETASDEVNARLFQEQGSLPSLPEPTDPFTRDPLQPGYPALQQQPGDAPEPVPHPSLFGFGGW